MEHEHDEYCGCPSPEVIMHGTKESIKKYGWHAVGVGAGEDQLEEPEFLYTVGLFETFGHSELVVSGLPNQIAHSIVSRAVEKIEQEALSEGEFYEEFIRGYKMRVDLVEDEKLRKFTVASKYYQSLVPFMQLVWPDKNHFFPGQEIDPVIEKVQRL